MTEVKKFSLLGAVKQSQEKKNVETPVAVVNAPVTVTAAAPANPVSSKPVEEAAPRKSLLHGGYLLAKKPSVGVGGGGSIRRLDSNGGSTGSTDVQRIGNDSKAPVPVGRNNLLAGVQKAKESQEKAQADMAYIFNEMPVDFKEMLDRFDALLTRDTGINDFNIDMIRAYVKRIMMDLREHPEYDGLVIDRDVHNVIKFIRETKSRAIEASVDKKEKAEKKKANSGKNKNRFGDVGGFIDFGPAGIAELANSGDEWELK